MKLDVLDPSSASFEEFLALPAWLMGGDPRWIPTDPEVERRGLDAEAAFRTYGDLQMFLVRDGDRPVARCAAMVNPRIRAESTPVGLIGFFESIDDYGAASMLLDAAVGWARERGAASIWGPMNFSIWHSYRFMTKGFDQIPYPGEPYNPAYYPEFFERYGFGPIARWRSWDLTEAHVAMYRAAMAATDRQALEKSGFRARTLTREEFDEFLPKIYELLSEGFRHNFGYSEVGLEEFTRICQPLRSLVVPGASPVVVFDPDGAPCAYAYIFPDVGPDIRRAAGLPEAGLEATTSPYRGKRVVFHTVVVAKKYRKQGIVHAFVGQQSITGVGEHGFVQGVGAVAKDGPTVYDPFGAHSREYHLYALT